MTHSFDGFNYLIKLNKGERLSEAIEQFIQETKVEGAWVSGVGAALEATLGFYDLDAKAYQWQTFGELREIVSLSGNLAFDEQGKMMYHLHGVLSDRQYQTVGGHIRDLVAGGTVELFVHRAYQPMKRKLDPAVGLQTLDL
ncbi:MAG: PPC domain-containing DNA-binding protein [Patescibacteria group bacterium]